MLSVYSYAELIERREGIKKELEEYHKRALKEDADCIAAAVDSMCPKGTDEPRSAEVNNCELLLKIYYGIKPYDTKENTAFHDKTFNKVIADMYTKSVYDRAMTTIQLAKIRNGLLLYFTKLVCKSRRVIDEVRELSAQDELDGIQEELNCHND